MRGAEAAHSRPSSMIAVELWCQPPLTFASPSPWPPPQSGLDGGKDGVVRKAKDALRWSREKEGKERRWRSATLGRSQPAGCAGAPAARPAALTSSVRKRPAEAMRQVMMLALATRSNWASCGT